MVRQSGLTACDWIGPRGVLVDYYCDRCAPLPPRPADALRDPWWWRRDEHSDVFECNPGKDVLCSVCAILIAYGDLCFMVHRVLRKRQRCRS